MPEKNSGWTRPGEINVRDEARKGTAAADPVVVVTPDGDVAGVRLDGGRIAVPDAGAGAGAKTVEAEEPRDTRSPAEIEADLERTRERLTGTLDELSERLSPRDLARRGGRRVKAQFVDERSGRVRRDRAASVLGGLGGAVGALVLLRKVRGRSS